MPNPLYDISCPSCGLEMTPHAGYADSAPWLCGHCHRGFWVAELSAGARRLYRPLLHDWGFSSEAQALRAAVEAEREQARARGTSAREEHLGFLADGHLSQLQRLPLNEEFGARVKAAAPVKRGRR